MGLRVAYEGREGSIVVFSHQTIEAQSVYTRETWTRCSLCFNVLEGLVFNQGRRQSVIRKDVGPNFPEYVSRGQIA